MWPADGSMHMTSRFTDSWQQTQDRAVVFLRRMSEFWGRWRREWRRTRVARSRTRTRQVYALWAALCALATVFVWCLAYVSPHPAGMRITIDQYTAVASHHQLQSALFRDEDSQIVGRITCPVANST